PRADPKNPRPAGAARLRPAAPPRPAGRGHDLRSPTLGPQDDISDRLYAASQHEFDERPGRAEDRPAEIPRRQHANVRPLVPEIASDPHGYRAGPGKIPLEARNDPPQRLEAAGQQAVRVAILRRAGARNGGSPQPDT